MVFALSLVVSLVLAAVLASMVTAPLRRISSTTRAVASGDLTQRVEASRLEELDALAQSFNEMAAKLKTSFDDLVGEVQTRQTRERELQESEARVRTSEERSAARGQCGRPRHVGLGRGTRPPGLGRLDVPALWRAEG
jgi:nitrate/nitrite-specific signal transduction histidine kinase